MSVVPLEPRTKPIPASPEPYLSRMAIAEHMGVSTGTIDRWCREGAPYETWGLRTKKFRATRVVAWAKRRAA